MNKSFLNREKAMLTVMVQAGDPDRIKELMDRSTPLGAEAFGVELERLKPEYKKQEIYKDLISYTDLPVYVTNYRTYENEGKTDEELAAIIADDAKPIFVAVDESGDVLGYAFCVHQQYVDNNIMTDVKTLYIDDLCVDENRRGMHIGKQLYDYVVEYAKNSGCYNVTLNVWSLNPGAMKFYEKCGLVSQKVGMEKIL